jgi:hypothetical protein
MGDLSTTAAIRLLVITVGTVTGGLVSGFAIKRYALNTPIPVSPTISNPDTV